MVDDASGVLVKSGKANFKGVGPNTGKGNGGKLPGKVIPLGRRIDIRRFGKKKGAG